MPPIYGARAPVACPGASFRLLITRRQANPRRRTRHGQEIPKTARPSRPLLAGATAPGVTFNALRFTTIRVFLIASEE